ncbi:MAG: NADH-quinone oxidoreductase subunit N, partial [Nitrospina sp.]|nr:NADH-quinone oxidoreductase subunit N [Nitrospina sp.]
IALSMTVFLLSLGGLPPFAGFIAKFYIFSAAVQEGLITLVIIAVLNSAISFYYYLKVVVFMYMKESEAEFRISLTPLTLFVVFVGVIATVSLGIFPGSIIALASH